MKKIHSTVNLDKHSKLFVQIGLVLSLAIAYFLLESKTFDKEITTFNDLGLVVEVEDPELIEYKLEQLKSITQVLNIDEIKKKKDYDEEFTETVINTITFDESVNKIPHFIPIDTVIDINSNDEVPFYLIEDAPVFPGCKGNNGALKACFSKKIRSFIVSKFNTDLANELGLKPGKQRIYTIFKIDKNGNVVDVQAKSPYKKFQKEAIRIIKKLPKMKPGMLQKVPVNVRYSMPITFNIR